MSPSLAACLCPLILPAYVLAGSRALDVTDFGAVPDDDKDDTSAFAAALEQAAETGPAEVFVPAGRYLVQNARLRLGSGTVLRGAGRGRTLLQSTGQGDPDALLLPEGEDILICDLPPRGRDAGVPPYYTAAGSLIVLRHARHVRVERCRFEHFSYGVTGWSADGGFYTVSDIAVRDCRFATGRVGVSFQACERIAVYESQFEGVDWAGSTSRCLGSRFSHNDVRDATTGIRGLHAFDVHVSHNTFRNVSGNGAVQFDTALHASITHNLIDNQNSVSTTNRPWTIEVEAAAGVVIQGNVIRASQQHDQNGIFIHGRFGGWQDWGIDPFDERRAGDPEYETSFIEGTPDEVARWTVAQPGAVQIASDPETPWRGQPSFRLRISPSAAPGVLARRPFTDDQKHAIYGDVIVAFVAVRGNTAPPKALQFALCLDDDGTNVAQRVLVPAHSQRFAGTWHTYRTLMYERGAGFGFVRPNLPFKPFRSIAVVLAEPLEQEVDVRIGTFRRAFAWQSNRDAGTVVSDNLVSNAMTGIVLSQILKNVSVTNNSFEAAQSRHNQGAEAIQLLTWHTVVRDTEKVVDPKNVPENAPADWVPRGDPWPTDPSALIYENCRIAANRADGYRAFIGVAGIDNGRLILQEPRLGLTIVDNQLQRTPRLLPDAFPTCIRVAGNSRDNHPTAGTVTLGKPGEVIVENPGLQPMSAVRFSPLNPAAHDHPLRLVSLGQGTMTLDPGAAPAGAVYAWEIWSDHLPR